MNWKFRRDIERRLRAIEHCETCDKDACRTCSRMLTGDKLVALARDTRRLLAAHDALRDELKEMKEQRNAPDAS